jgi:hypothetical protein
VPAYYIRDNKDKMPSKRSPYSRGRRSLRGKGSALNWIKNAAKSIHGFVKKNKLLSKGGNWLASSGLVNDPRLKMALAGATSLASKAGYGRRRARMGMGVRLAGGALRLAGARRY